MLATCTASILYTDRHTDGWTDWLIPVNPPPPPAKKKKKKKKKKKEFVLEL